MREVKHSLAVYSKTKTKTTPLPPAKETKTALGSWKNPSQPQPGPAAVGRGPCPSPSAPSWVMKCGRVQCWKQILGTQMSRSNPLFKITGKQLSSYYLYTNMTVGGEEGKFHCGRESKIYLSLTRKSTIIDYISVHVLMQYLECSLCFPSSVRR